MQPSHFRQANLVLKAPPGEEENVVDLPVFANRDENTVTSLWLPTDEEREIIAQGGGIAVTIWGLTHPPVMVGAARLDYGVHYEAQDAAPMSS